MVALRLIVRVVSFVVFCIRLVHFLEPFPCFRRPVSPLGIPQRGGSLEELWEELVNPRIDTNWFVFGCQSNSDQLQFVDKGSRGLEDLRRALVEAQREQQSQPQASAREHGEESWCFAFSMRSKFGACSSEKCKRCLRVHERVGFCEDGRAWVCVCVCGSVSWFR